MKKIIIKIAIPILQKLAARLITDVRIATLVQALLEYIRIAVEGKSNSTDEQMIASNIKEVFTPTVTHQFLGAPPKVEHSESDFSKLYSEFKNR